MVKLVDRNGLELSPPFRKTKTSYIGVAYSPTVKGWSAYRNVYKESPDDSIYAMSVIEHGFECPLDAAFVAQTFSRKFSAEEVRDLVDEGYFKETAREFLAGLEIPEWKYPHEGLSVKDILDGVYRVNYVPDAKSALTEVIKIFNLKTPALNMIDKYIEKVDNMYDQGLTYRKAAIHVMKGIE